MKRKRLVMAALLAMAVAGCTPIDRPQKNEPDVTDTMQVSLHRPLVKRYVGKRFGKPVYYLVLRKTDGTKVTITVPKEAYDSCKEVGMVFNLATARCE